MMQQARSAARPGQRERQRAWRSLRPQLGEQRPQSPDPRAGSVRLDVGRLAHEGYEVINILLGKLRSGHGGECNMTSLNRSLEGFATKHRASLLRRHKDTTASAAS